MCVIDLALEVSRPTRCLVYEMLLAGFDTSEPHLECLLKRFQKRSFDALKEKLNIPVPVSPDATFTISPTDKLLHSQESAYVYGVVDELGVLEEGEVYINLPYRGGPQVGDFVVSRNPAYSPSGKYSRRCFSALNTTGFEPQTCGVSGE